MLEHVDQYHVSEYQQFSMDTSLAKYIKGCYWPYVPKDNPRAKYACGRCPNCLKRRIDMWSYRLQHHFKYVKHVYFITLTYGRDNITRSPNGFLNLNPPDFVKYIKRIRKHLKQDKHTPFNDQVKYIVTGEYGTKRARPHYHAIIVNVPAAVLSELWEHGIIQIDEVNPNRIAYIFKYCQKARIRKQTHSRDDRVPEYVNFSKGLGKQWLNTRGPSYHVRNIDNPTITLPTGERIAIPRYYKERIFSASQREYIAERMQEITPFNDPSELTPEDQQRLLQWKNEKVRIMNKKAKKDKL